MSFGFAELPCFHQYLASASSSGSLDLSSSLIVFSATLALSDADSQEPRPATSGTRRYQCSCSSKEIESRCEQYIYLTAHLKATMMLGTAHLKACLCNIVRTPSSLILPANIRASTSDRIVRLAHLSLITQTCGLLAPSRLYHTQMVPTATKAMHERNLAVPLRSPERKDTVMKQPPLTTSSLCYSDSCNCALTRRLRIVQSAYGAKAMTTHIGIINKISTRTSKVIHPRKETQPTSTLQAASSRASTRLLAAAFSPSLSLTVSHRAISHWAQAAAPRRLHRQARLRNSGRSFCLLRPHVGEKPLHLSELAPRHGASSADLSYSHLCCFFAFFWADGGL